MGIIADVYTKHMKRKIDEMDLTDAAKAAFKTLVSELDSEYVVDIFRFAESISTNKFFATMMKEEHND